MSVLQIHLTKLVIGNPSVAVNHSLLPFSVHVDLRVKMKSASLRETHM